LRVPGFCRRDLEFYSLSISDIYGKIVQFWKRIKVPDAHSPAGVARLRQVPVAPVPKRTGAAGGSGLRQGARAAGPSSERGASGPQERSGK
jgi:hypothetical protein